MECRLAELWGRVQGVPPLTFQCAYLGAVVAEPWLQASGRWSCAPSQAACLLHCPPAQQLRSVSAANLSEGHAIDTAEYRVVLLTLIPDSVPEERPMQG